MKTSFSQSVAKVLFSVAILSGCIDTLRAQLANPPPSCATTGYYLLWCYEGWGGGDDPDKCYYQLCVNPNDTGPTCPPNGSGGGPGGGGSGGGASGGGTAPPKRCRTCDSPGGGGGSGSSCPCEDEEDEGGMPYWEIQEPNLNLYVHDKPLFYRTSRGKEVAFKMHYKNTLGENGYTDNRQPGIFSVGTNWHSPWRTYLQRSKVVGNESGVNDSTNLLFFVFLGDGSARQFPLTRAEYVSGAILTTTNEEYYLTFPSGKRYVYGNWVRLANSSGTNDYCFLTRKEDPSSNILSFTYTVTTSGGLTNSIRLNKVTDSDGRETSFVYTNTSYFSNLLVQVNGPYNLTSTLAHGTSAQLTNITDVIGLSSRFEYHPSTGLTNLVTPYGTNRFDYYVNSGAKAIRATELGLRSNLHLEGYDDANALPSAIDESTSLINFQAAHSIQTNAIQTRGFDVLNTFHWGPRQYQNLPSGIRAALDDWSFDPYSPGMTTNDLQLGWTRHWLKLESLDGKKYASKTLSLQRDPSPDNSGATEGLLTWYGYLRKEGNTNTSVTTRMGYPSLIAWREPGADWQAKRFQRNKYMSVATVSETFSVRATAGFMNYWTTGWRTHVSLYATNNIDIVATRLQTGSLDVLESSNVVNSYHQVVTNYNALGEMTRYEYNAGRQMTGAYYPDGLRKDYAYGTNGFLSSVVDRDTAGDVYFHTNSYTWTNGYLLTHTDAHGLTITNTWDALGRLTKVSYPDGTSINHSYQNLDRVKTVDRLGYAEGYAYNGLRELIRFTNANNKVTTYSYCNCGSLESVTDALGNATTYTYDNLGRRLRTTKADTTWVESAYDSLSRPIRITDNTGYAVTNQFLHGSLIGAQSNPMGVLSRMIYDEEDRATNILSADGTMTIKTYDDLGRVTTIQRADYLNESGGDFVSLVDSYEYSPRGLVAHTDPLGRITGYFLDELRRKTMETNANDEVTQFSYGPGGVLLTLTDGKSQVTSWKYDEYGWVTNKFDANNTLIFRYAYDANGRLSSRWTPEKGYTYYSYDSVGNMTAVNYPSSTDLAFSYDAVNRLTNMVDAVGTTAFGFNSVGAISSEDGPWDNDTLSYSYANGLRSSITLAQPSSTSWAQTYAYDLMKRMTNVSSGAGTFGYAYQETIYDGNAIEGSVYEESLPSPFTLPGNRVARMTYPGGSVMTNLYDIHSRHLGTYLRNSGGTLLNQHVYEYDDASRRIKQTRTGGDFIDYTYDDIGQLASALGKESGGTTNRWQERFFYGYDTAGNLSNRVQNVQTNVFHVNNLNQLTSTVRTNTSATVAGFTAVDATSVTVAANGGAATAAIRYADRTYARTNVTLANGTNTFTAVATDSAGRGDTNTISVNLPVAVSFLYDQNGNLRTNGTRVFEYDDENQLTRITEPNSWKSEFVYDGKLRMRISRDFTWRNGVWAQTNETRRVYDGMLVIQERDQFNAARLTYTRGKDLSGSMEGAGGIGGLLAVADHKSQSIDHSYFQADGNGNVTALVDTNQNVVARYLFDPFGNTLSATGPKSDVNKYRFSSKEAQSQSGLVYYGYRFYEPSLQRWPNRDPKEERGGVNLYQFALNDPIALVDYFGLQAGGCKDEASCLGCITYAEARGTPDKCQKAVADSIKNRASNQNKSVCDVIAEPKQYDGYNNKNYQDCCNNKCKNIPGGPQNKTERDKAFENASSGTASENAGDATYFHDTSIGTPPWIERNIRNGRMSEVNVPGCNRFRFYKVN